MPEAVIVATGRTPIGRANKGSLVECRPDDLSALVLRSVLEQVPQLNPAEVEDVLLGHPSVAEVAVTGAPSDEWGEIVCAWVVPDGASHLDVDAVLAYAAQRLAPYKRPRRLNLVDALPRNSMGKVRRSELR